jgi:hypothetical protein
MQTGASTTWNVGDVILDLYKVTDILGEGGFGTVYKVRHQGWNLDLAVKSPKPEIVAAAGGVESMGLNLSGYFHAQGEDGERNLIYQVTDDTLHRKVASILVSVT